MSDDRRRKPRRSEDRGMFCATRLAVLFSVLALIVACTGTITALTQLGAVSETARNLGQSELATCQRVQTLRDQSNREARVVYLTLDGASRSARARGARRFSRFYRRLAATVTFTPPTNCKRAVSDSLSYVPPRPIRFVECRRPPGSEFRGCARR